MKTKSIKHKQETQLLVKKVFLLQMGILDILGRYGAPWKRNLELDNNFYNMIKDLKSLQK